LNPFHIAVFHKGNETDSLTQFVVENGLQNYISMRGFQDNIPSLLPAFDLGLLPSHWEALANNLREYMWAGLCPMVSDIPGSLELVAHKQTGLVHTTGNASDIAATLKFALAAPVQVAQWGCAAREFSEEHLCMSACAQRLEIEFKSLFLKT
jgi:glycosyltransferase involved in cell wall biosynthesis